MSQQGKQTPINPGIIARVTQAARYAISGVTPSTWFGPSQPMEPQAQQVAGRRFDYPVGSNLRQTPRGYEPVSFRDLRALADNCDVLRSVIETRKDQMESMDFIIRPRAVNGSTEEATDDQKRRGEAVMTFLQSPDRRSSWAQWQRQLLEDRFVVDAAALYRRRTRGGQLYALEILDGATLMPVIDESGRTPLPDEGPAYQQILHGIPAVDYTSDEVLYLARNQRSWKLYGYSEVEQILITANTSIRRALHQLEYYRDGSVPDAFVTLPANLSVDQIKLWQSHLDSMLSGNSAERRKVRMMPDGTKYLPTKEPLLKDVYDEWLARIICFTFSISPEPFVEHTNKGTAETAHDRAIQEGLLPLQRWVKGFIDRVIAEDFASPDLEFAWEDDREMDPKQAADILSEKVKSGIISIDEARERDGLDQLGGAYSVPMLATPAGFVAPTTPEEQQAAAQAAQDARQAQAEQPKPGSQPADAHAHDEAAKLIKRKKKLL